VEVTSEDEVEGSSGAEGEEEDGTAEFSFEETNLSFRETSDLGIELVESFTDFSVPFEVEGGGIEFA